jgi:Protein of unknown function (DUF2924)
MEKMRANISDQIASLRTLPRQQLFEMWRKLYRRPAPTGIRRELMIPFLAYRTQENAYGGLKRSTRSELRRIARGIENPSSSSDRMRQPRLKPGTQIIRQWHGEKHEVVVTEPGYQYRQVTYKSLSEIARKITGTRWSGPAFFGLKTPKPDSRRHDD